MPYSELCFLETRLERLFRATIAMMRQCAKTVASVKRLIMEVVALSLLPKQYILLKDIQKEKQDGLKLGKYSRYILQVVTIVLDTVANENATVSIAAIFCSVRI